MPHSHALSTPSAGPSVAAAEPPDSDPAGSRFISGLAAVLGKGDLGVPQLVAAVELVRDDPSAFASWLAAVARDTTAAGAVAARSYWHPNGFAKLVLHTSAEPEFKLRMHIWLDSTEPGRGETNPHRHRWEFASTVIAGRGILVPEYREDAGTGAPFTRYRYGTDPARPAALVADGAVRLVGTRSPQVLKGAVYACDTEVIHTLEPLGQGLTATVVVQGPHRTSATAVYCAPGESEDQPNRALSVAEFQELASAVVAEVDGCPSRR